MTDFKLLVKRLHAETAFIHRVKMPRIIRYIVPGQQVGQTLQLQGSQAVVCFAEPQITFYRQHAEVFHSSTHQHIEY